MSLDPDDNLVSSPGRDPSDAARLVVGDDTPPPPPEKPSRLALARAWLGLPAFAPHGTGGPSLAEYAVGYAAAQPLTLVAPGPPWKVLNAGRTYYTVWLDPAFSAYKTSDGRPFAWCIRKGFIDHGMLCGLRWWETTDPRQATFRFGLRTGYQIAAITGHSGYVHAVRGGRDILLGDRLKPAFGERPPSSINYTRFAMHGWGICNGFWTYDGGGRPTPDGMENANFSVAIGAPGWGYNAAQRATLRRYYGPPWLAL